MVSALCTAVVKVFLSFTGMFPEQGNTEWLSLVCPLVWNRGCGVQVVVVMAVTL